MVFKIRQNGSIELLPKNDTHFLHDWVKQQIGVLSSIEYKTSMYFTGLANNDSKEYLLQIPNNKYVGIRTIEIRAEAEAEIYLYRNPNVTDYGLDITNEIRNMNLYNSIPTECKLYEDPVYTNSGEEIEFSYTPGIGSVTYIMGEIGDNLLVSNMELMLSILNKSGGTMNRCTVKILFREWSI